MTDGSDISGDRFSVEVKFDLTVTRAIKVLGTGSNLQELLTNILNEVVTTRLVQLNARVLTLQASNLKKIGQKQLQSENKPLQDEELSLPVPKGILETQQQLQALQKVLLSGGSLPSKDSGERQEESEIPLNVYHFIAIQTLGKAKNRTIDLDLVDLLLEMGNNRVNELNVHLARELVGQGTMGGTMKSVDKDGLKETKEKIHPVLAEQRDLLTTVGNLEEKKEQLASRDRQLKSLRDQINPFANICAEVLQLQSEEIATMTVNLLQKEMSVLDSLSYEVLYDRFKDNVPNFDELARTVSLEKKPTPKPLESLNVKLVDRQVKPKRIVDKAFLAELASEPQDFREIITKLGIKDMSEARNLQIQMEKQDSKPPIAESPMKPVKPRNRNRRQSNLPASISEETVLDALTSEPQDIRDIITQMGITDMADARYLQIVLRTLEMSERLIVEIRQGRKLYRKMNRE